MFVIVVHHNPMKVHNTHQCLFVVVADIQLYNV
jgi:hypothetical protein